VGDASLGAIVVFGVASSFNVQSPFLAVMGPVWIVSSFGIARRVTPDDTAQRPTANRRLVA
jgi:hypothetical protein